MLYSSFPHRNPPARSLRNRLAIAINATPHTLLHLTPHTSHLTPHTSHLTPHTSHLTPHTSHLTPHQGLNSYLELTLPSNKTVASILKHLNQKWSPSPHICRLPHRHILPPTSAAFHIATPPALTRAMFTLCAGAASTLRFAFGCKLGPLTLYHHSPKPLTFLRQPLRIALSFARLRSVISSAARKHHGAPPCFAPNSTTNILSFLHANTQTFLRCNPYSTR